MYWDLFNGACGHTYGHHSVWQMTGSKRSSVTVPGGKNRPLMPWFEAIEAPGAAQMRHAKDLLLSYPFFTRIPDPDLVVPGAVPELVPGGGTRRFVATRDAEGTFALVYAPVGCAFAVMRGRGSSPRPPASSWTGCSSSSPAKPVAGGEQGEQNPRSWHHCVTEWGFFGMML